MFGLGTGVPAKFAKPAMGQKSHSNRAAVIGFRVPNASMSDPLTFFTKSTFAAHLGTEFRLRQGRSLSATVTLIEINDLMPTKTKVTGPVVGGRECFLLTFTGKVRPTGPYTLELAVLGSMQL